MKRAGLFARWFRTRPEPLPEPTALTMEATLDRILRAGASLSRFGDGELKLAHYRRSLRFQPKSRPLISGLLDALNQPKTGYLPCVNFQFMQDFDWVRLSAYERYGPTTGAKITIVAPDDGVLLRRKKVTTEYRAHWRRIVKTTEVPEFGSAGVFFLAYYIDAYREGRTEEVLEKFRQLFNSRRILFVAPTTPMGGQSFAEQVPLMRRLGLKSAQFIAVPETDAYAATPRVLAEIEKACGYDDIFLSAGPAASVWAHQLAGRRDGRVLDVGSFNTQLRYLV
jgi:hypothetical protein